MVVLLAGGLALLALPGACRRVGRTLPPPEWARLCLFALVAGTVVVQVALVLYAAPTVLGTLGLHAAATACTHLLGDFAPGGRPAGWTAAGAVTATSVLACFAVQRARRAHRAVRVEPGLGRHSAGGDYDVVVLPTAAPVAVSVAGRPGQILLSEGLAAGLPPEQVAAVIRHEAAHLRHRHHRHLLLATVLEHAFAVFPPVRRSTGALRLALERWADEEAGGGAEPRRAVRAALLNVTGALVTPPAAAFSPVETVAERLDALAAPPVRPSAARRLAVYLPGAAVAAAVLVALGTSAAEARMVLAMAGSCPV